jgi:hypothetical protein
LQHHFGRIAVSAALILPFAGLHLAFDIHKRAFAKIALRNIGKLFIRDGDVMPFRLFFLVAVAVLPALRRGNAEIHNLAAVLEVSHFRGAAQPAKDDHFVDAAHASVSSSAGSS